jgi:hypothetical protein
MTAFPIWQVHPEAMTAFHTLYRYLLKVWVLGGGRDEWLRRTYQATPHS